MRTKPPVKMPVHPKHQCQLIDRRGVKCDRIEWSIMTRGDGTSMRLCQLHSRKMRDQINANPERFNQVRFSLVVK